METEVDTFDVLADLVRQGFAAALKWGDNKLYTTEDSSLVGAYLSGFAEGPERQWHNCSCCKHFLNRYGGLVVIDGAGNVRSAMWDFIEFDGLPQQMDAPVQNLLRAVSKAKVNGVFLSSLPNWGTAVTGDWHHFAVTPPASILHKRSVLTAGQRMAELREDFQMLRRGLDEYSADTFNQAVAVLQGNTLYRSDKFLGIAQSLAALKTLTAIPINKQSARALMWRAVAMLPAGACHIKSSMIGTLLDDLQAGLPFASVQARFDAKMSPLLYQRAQVAPSAGNIVQAEKLVEQLGIKPSLDRRYAAVGEVLPRAIWSPSTDPGVLQAAAEPTGAFAGLKAKPSPKASIVAGTAMSWTKFVGHVLPRATCVEFITSNASLPFGAITAACDPAAPPLYVWDDEANRNPFSWYKWVGVKAADFNLAVGAAVRVLAIVPTPSMWTGNAQHDGAILLLKGAEDTNFATAGLGLFSEILRPELRQVRSTIEAHSNQNVLQPAPGPQAAGIVLRKGLPVGLTLRVTTGPVAIDYSVDRWD